MTMSKQVNEFVEVNSRYSRSVNIGLDYLNNCGKTGYIVTGNVLSSINSILSGLAQQGGQKSYCLLGLYGSGKSAFSVFLTQLLSKNRELAKSAENLIRNKGLNPDVYAFIHARNKSSYLPVLITGRRVAVNKLMLEGMLTATESLQSSEATSSLRACIENSLNGDQWEDSKIVLEYLDRLGACAKRQGYAGLILILDEAGKSMEYALGDKHGGDVYILQEIAEYAQRVKEFSLLFIITLHQQMDSYSELLSRTNRAEWAKIQERFENVHFTETINSTIRLISEAINPKKEAPQSIYSTLTGIVNELFTQEKIAPRGMTPESLKAYSHKAWPLHPTLLIALPHIFRRFAQNERSIFSYLASGEYGGFQESIHNNVVDIDSGLIRIKDIFDYLLGNYELTLSRNPHSKRMLEANDLINSRYNLDEDHVDALKTIAVLNALSEMSPLRASMSMLKLALPKGENAEKIIESLMNQSLLTYRRLDGSYRIWEGSDVDLEERLAESRRHLHFDASLFLDTIEKHLKQKHMVARRHSMETGIMRYFAIHYTDHFSDTQQLTTQEVAEGASGIILVVIPNKQISQMIVEAQQISSKNDKLIIAIPKQMDSMFGVVQELASLLWVEDNTEELRDDRVARRELSLRISAYELELARQVQSIIDPRPNPFGNSCVWIWRGVKQDVGTPAGVSRLISQACDDIYKKGAKLRNEMISRDDISSAASGARRVLMEKILSNGNKKTLGMSGYPPERSIYESIVNAAEMHVFDNETNKWKFQAPPKDNSVGLRPTWDKMERLIFNDDLEPVRLDQLYSKLSMPPYGLPEGVFPILITLFYQINIGETFLYREDSFLPDPQFAHFELMQRRLDLFSIKGIKIKGTREAIIDRLANSLDTEPEIASVVRALYRMMSGLPAISMKSIKYKNRQTIDFKDALLNASAPEDLLFKDIPKAFGMKTISADTKKDDTIYRYFDSLNSSITDLAVFAPNMLSWGRDVLLNSCGLAPGENGWIELIRRCHILQTVARHEELTPFINSVIIGSKAGDDPTPALSVVSKRSFDQWLDSDIDTFEGLANGIGGLFIRYWESYGTESIENKNEQAEHRASFKTQLRDHLNNMHNTMPIEDIRTLIEEILTEMRNNNKGKESS